MISLAKLDDLRLDALLASQRSASFSYDAIGLSRGGLAPDDYQVDHNRTRIGTGLRDFDRAVAAVHQWRMFHLPWVRIYPSDTPIATGEQVAVVATIAGVEWANVTRIVYVIDEQHETLAGRRRFGFGYGTLPDHAERGEERFSVEWHQDDDSVWYDVLAFSRPHHPLARLGYPLARRMQRRFGTGTLEAMRRALRDTPG